MKKLFTSFISLMTIGTFGQCGFKNNDKSQSSSSASDQQKVEKKEKQVEPKTTSGSSSSSVKSSTRNQYLRKSHEEWIADSLSKMKPKLKDNQEYKDAFNDWKDTGDAQVAKIKAYSKSDAFKQAFANWKTNPRTKEEFVDQIARSRDTAGYKIYDAWIKSPKGELEMKNLYDQGVAFYDSNYKAWAKTISDRTTSDYAADWNSDPAFSTWVISVDAKNDLQGMYERDGSYFQDGYDAWKVLPDNHKTEEQYAESRQSDNAFEGWIRSGSGKSSFSQAFKTHTDGIYESKYRDWQSDTDAQINAYIESGDTSLTTYNAWRIKPHVRDDLKTLWEDTTDGQNEFDYAVKNWDGEGNPAPGDPNNDLGTKEAFKKEQNLDNRNAPSQIYKDWVNAGPGAQAFINAVARSGVVGINNVPLGTFQRELVKARPLNIYDMRRNPNQVTLFRNSTFLAALDENNAFSTQTLRDEYLKWKKAQYKKAENTEKYTADLDRWTDGKKASTNPDVKSKFKTAIEAPNSPELRAFNTWKTSNINKDSYDASSSFVDDLVEWAKTKKTNSDQGVKSAFISAIQSGSSPGDIQLQGKYNIWKIKDENEYQADDSYRQDISTWAHEKKNNPLTTQDWVNHNSIIEAFKNAMKSTSPYGDKELKDTFDEWKTPTHAKYRAWRSFNRDFGQFLQDDTTTSEDVVQNRIEAIVESTNPTEGNLDLKNAFIAWQPTSKENFVKSETESSKFTTWSDGLSEVDLAILDEITKMLQDKDLFTKTKGNSEFVKLLKQITKDSYDSYVLTL